MELNSNSFIKEIKCEAWNLLKSNWLESILSTLTIWICYILPYFWVIALCVLSSYETKHKSTSMTLNSNNELIIAIPMILLMIIGCLLARNLNYGFHKLIFNMVFQYDTPYFLDIFYGFKNLKNCRILNKAKRSFKKAIPFGVEYVSLVLISVFIIGGIIGILSREFSYTIFSSLLIILLSVYQFYNSKFTACYYIYLANESMLIDDAIYTTNDIFKYTYKKQAFYKLHLSLLGWYILSIASLGIGFIIFLPYLKIVQAIFFKEALSK